MQGMPKPTNRRACYLGAACEVTKFENNEMPKDLSCGFSVESECLHRPFCTLAPVVEASGIGIQ